MYPACLSLSNPFSAPGMSILFAATIIGFPFLRIFSEKLMSSSLPHLEGLWGSRPSSSMASFIVSSPMPSPENFFASSSSSSPTLFSTTLVILCQSSSRRPITQYVSSSSTSLTSSTGSPEPGSTGFPSGSVEPDASATTISAEACLISSRNLRPRPRPLWASLIIPGQSITSMGMNLFPSMHLEFLGLSLTPSSLQTHFILR